MLRVCVELGVDPLPPIYAVADGFLLLLPKPSEKRLAGVVRLRGLSEHLLIPVNAELVPPLLHDEASALIKKRGLVFLPGSRVLEFDPARPVSPASLLRIERVQRRPWKPLPEPTTLANELTEITLFTIDTPDQILQQGGEGIGTDAPTLQGSGLPSQILGNALFQIGKGMAWLGNAMNAKPLAGLGAKLLGGAMSMMPALSEKLMGKQEAMLRELLRQFREGHIDKALRHALPLGADPSRGMAPASSAQLPTHNLFYSLLNLLGGASAGPGSLWFTPDQTYYELLKEYRKQAEAAAGRGDFRRAAFIYAKLLNDFPSAARVLSQGGLHRDAAILYEKKLANPTMAAKEWEAAGEIERALHLYRTMGDHGEAGDLLRRIGEEDRAVQEYQIAAAKLLEAGPKHYEAGELLRVRGQRPDLALEYYDQGWQQRPDGNALSCLTRLVQHHAEASEAEPFLAVLTEAEAFLVERDAESAATFFTEIARLAKAPSLTPIADELQDRALIGMAKKMRQGSHASSVNWFNSPSVWPVPLVGDAHHALSEARKPPRSTPVTYHTVQAGRSTVTAVCQMPLSGQVILGFENGEVVLFEPTTNGVHELTRESGPILSLVMDEQRKYLVILSQLGPDKVCVRALSRDLGFRMMSYHLQNVDGPAQLALAATPSHSQYAVLCNNDGECHYYTLPNLICVRTIAFDQPGVLHVIVHGTLDARQSSWWILAISGDYSELFMERERPSQKLGNILWWVPTLGEGSTLLQIPVWASLLDDGMLQLHGLDQNGNLCRSTIRLPIGSATERWILHSPRNERYRAFACVRGDLIAGVHVKGVDWWTPAHKQPAQTTLTLKNPIAAFALPNSRELLIVESGGLLTRVPVVE